ncbi:hypothetical protein AB7714_28210 [Tardiphaga sp. 1201_B9_N1_1]|uniref:hypothetical protein n=1 Tax=unclassified Tardiphaga TaxID=2631404 RepID=UPI003F27D6F1
MTAAQAKLFLEDQSCRDCRFFIADPSRRADDGNCHRHAPAATFSPVANAYWPLVSSSNWCGEFVIHPGEGAE